MTNVIPAPISPLLLIPLKTSFVSVINVVLPLFSTPLMAYLFASSNKEAIDCVERRGDPEGRPVGLRHGVGGGAVPVFDRVKPYFVASERLVARC